MFRFIALTLLMVGASAFASKFPAAFDLRNVSESSYVSSVKNQKGGTCWTHATMASIESNLMVNGTWTSEGESGEPNLAEYHLDWWNGFNKSYNADIYPKRAGLRVHLGGDYRLAAAYSSRGFGVVRDVDGQSYSNPPKQFSDQYHYYYPRHIEWFDVGRDLSRIDRVKHALTTHGAIGTALTWSKTFYSKSSNTFYQSPSNPRRPNHAVTIVGWDDAKVTRAAKPGAWLIKNSWGTSFGAKGYFWISYYDKIAGHHDQMGAVQFRDVERWRYDHVYYHDYHGWRDTMKDSSEAFNAYKATGNDTVKAVSFYTTARDSNYTVRIYRSFENGQLSDEVASFSGAEANPGLHTFDIDSVPPMGAGDAFYVYLAVDKGGQAYDKTSDVPVLLGAEYKAIVPSRASPGESYFRRDGEWVDLVTVDATANFAIKALAVVQ